MFARTIFTLFALLHGTFSFTPLFTPRSPTFLRSSTSSSPPPKISGNNIALTTSLTDHTLAKLNPILSQFPSLQLTSSVYLTVSRNPAVKLSDSAEVVIRVAGGAVIRAKEDTGDMYSSIDQVAKRVKAKLSQYKERRLDGFHSGDPLATLAGGEEAFASVDEEAVGTFSAEEDPEAPIVTKVSSSRPSFTPPPPSLKSTLPPPPPQIKSFDLSKPISIQEAVFALDYVDHDFYVFRDAATDEVSVVYKRNAARGIGLIQPQ